MAGLCLKSTYFMYRDCFFEQTDSTAMRSPLSPVVAGVFMDSKTDSQSSGLGMWTTPSLSGPMEHLNGLCQKIQFTVEMEENSQLPYLDVLVHRDEDTLTTSVYHKKTKTDQYLPFQSQDHPQVKTSVASCLKKKAERVSRRKSLSKELQQFSDMFQAK